MNHLATRLLGVAMMLVASIALVGCDDEITSVEDLDIQPSIEVPGSVSLTLLSADSRANLAVSYQGLDEAPSAQATGNLVVELAEESGSATQGGERRWSIGYDGSVSGVAEETVTITTSSGGESIQEEVSVTVSPFVINSEFQPEFIIVEDYETAFVDESGSDNPVAQRPVTTTGGSEVTIQSDQVADNSTGVNAAQINAVEGGTVTMETPVSAPGADFFTFLVRSAESAFNLTLTFVEETGSGTTEHVIEVPISQSNAWRQYGIGFSQIGETFDPVAVRAGGSGSLQSVRLTTDADVTFEVDEFMLGTDQGPIAEINDFETTGNAYITFSSASFGFTDNVADNALGDRAREIGNGNFFGYNQNGIRVADGSNAVLKFRIGNVEEATDLRVFFETGADDNGGFGFDNGPVLSFEASSGWQDVEVPVSDMGTTPSAIANGLTNVGFQVEGGGTGFLIDDIRIDATGN